MKVAFLKEPPQVAAGDMRNKLQPGASSAARRAGQARLRWAPAAHGPPWPP